MAVTIVTIFLGFVVHFSYGIPVEEKHISERIVGGIEAEKGYAPHMAAMVFGTHVLSLICGGSIISKRHILTAAHCITSVSSSGTLLPTLRGIVGSNRWNSPDHLVEFQHFYNHPEYDSSWLTNDVGVLILAKELELHEEARAIPLNFNWVDGEVESSATGWGITGIGAPIANNLQVLHLKTISAQECIGQVQQHSGWDNVINASVQICTYHSPGHGMCSGDSGSALVMRETGQQIGIVSWGVPCAVGYPDVFTRISGVKEFIQTILQKDI